MMERATPERLAELRQEGRITPCYPVRNIYFLPETHQAPRHNCYVSAGPHFLAIRGPGEDEPDLVNINTVLRLEGVGPATDGRPSNYVLIPSQWED